MSQYEIAKIKNDPHIVVNEDARTPTVVRLTEYRGTLKVDLRQIWSPDDDENFVFTKKGAAFPVEDLDEVIEFLLSAREFVEGKEGSDG
jgi:hypothetical protein